MHINSVTWNHWYVKQEISKSECNYSIVEKEFFAIKKGLESFKKIVLGCNIFIKTDDKTRVNYDKIQSNKIERWKWSLDEYDISIIHVSNSENTITEAFSGSLRIVESRQKFQEEKKNSFFSSLR